MTPAEPPGPAGRGRRHAGARNAGRAPRPRPRPPAHRAPRAFQQLPLGVRGDGLHGTRQAEESNDFISKKWARCKN